MPTLGSISRAGFEIDVLIIRELSKSCTKGSGYLFMSFFSLYFANLILKNNDVRIVKWKASPYIHFPLISWICRSAFIHWVCFSTSVPIKGIFDRVKAILFMVGMLNVSLFEHVIFSFQTGKLLNLTNLTNY